jgi:hypothetical protein
MMDLFTKYEQAVRISTKGAKVVQNPKYLRKFEDGEGRYWVAWSLISADDSVLEQVDLDAPNCTERLKAMKALGALGVKNSLRFRPILPGISDSTRKEPKAWRTLLRKAAEAGCCAVSMEFAFVPGARPPHVEKMWKNIRKLAGFDIVKWYEETSIYGACLRSSRAWKEDLTYAIHEETKKLGMAFGISDPHWKELNDYGCCCGIDGEDPVFGGWMRKQATNALLDAKNAGKKVSARDGIPRWAKRIKMDKLVVMTGAHNAYRRATRMWADKLRDNWNDLKGARGPLGYFEGVLFPVGRTKKGDVLYEYRKPKRERRRSPHFKV